jgi:hypothetical protein
MAILDIGTFQGITMRAYDYEEITVSTSAVGLTATKVNPGGSDPEKARAAVIVVKSQPINFRVDGGDPTAGSGIGAVAGDQISVVGLSNLSQFKAIRSGASDATLCVTYFK